MGRSLALALVTWLLLAGPALAHPGPDTLELPVVTRDYLVTLRLGPPGREVPLDGAAPAAATAAGVVLCTTNPDGVSAEDLEQGTQHLEVHVLDRRTWRVIDTPEVAIAIVNTFTGQREAVAPTRMIDPDLGMADLHYGGNVFTPDGPYRVEVQVVGQPAAFDFVVRAGRSEPPPSLATVLVGRGLAPAVYLAFALSAFVVICLFARGRGATLDARGARWLFLSLLAFQGMHQLEHVIQVGQAFLLRQRGAAGLVGTFFGLEPVHLAYNTWFLALAIAVAATYAVHRRGDLSRPGLAAGLLCLGAGIQGYHVVEHLFKIDQFLATGLNGVPGLLGLYVNTIWLHFALNTAAFTPFVAAFFVGGLHRTVEPIRLAMAHGRRVA